MDKYYEIIILFFIIVSWFGIMLTLYNNSCDGCIISKNVIGNMLKPKTVIEYMKPVFGGENCDGITGSGCIIKEGAKAVREKTTGMFTDVEYYKGGRVATP